VDPAYKHTQSGYLITGALAVAVLIVASSALKTGFLAFPLLICGILVTCMVLFWNLTIEIGEQRLRWWFGPGVIHKSVPLEQIASVEAKRIQWWNGWGIHLTGNGWLYNVSGMEAVKVTLRSGKSFMLGTDEPQKLAEALRQSIR